MEDTSFCMAGPYLEGGGRGYYHYRGNNLGSAANCLTSQIFLDKALYGICMEATWSPYILCRPDRELVWRITLSLYGGQSIIIT